MGSGENTMAIRRVTLTYRDYEALPNDGRRYEIHDGELSVTPAPGTRHQEVLGNLYAILREYVLSRTLGKVFLSPTDVILSATTIVQPDIVYVATDRLRLISARGIEGAPTLAIEVISPSTAQTDRGVKLQLYARHRVPYYWIVDPDERSVEGYRLVQDGYETSAQTRGHDRWLAEPLPDFVISLSSIWA